ncbi:MAG: cytochrome-c peroxidase [Cytophagaceae bacterium SCN 52-12]|nr:MAG: cytochrome-c peroxidase [Cytophagaceae bacterium SCN 52-12]
MAACNAGKTDIPPAETPLVRIPANFPSPRLNADNPLTPEGVALGRQLFYDKRLSGNNRIACASCHDPAKSFSDGVALTSAGVTGTPLLRHSPALINLAWANTGLFWDGGSTNLESQALAPLRAEDEMHQDLVELVEELSAVPDYVSGFRKAFNDDIRPGYVMMALAQFQRTLVSADSRYDKFVRREDDEDLSPMEKEGLLLVRQKCQSCHSTDLFTDFLYHNNGLDPVFPAESYDGLYTGRYRITYDRQDMGAYKTPTLRNLKFTAPFMHDGRFSTLKQVIDHYSEGVRSSETLSPFIPENGFRFSEREKEAVLAFLETLTDAAYTVNPGFTAP